jgi:hypothetical protein
VRRPRGLRRRRWLAGDRHLRRAPADGSDQRGERQPRDDLDQLHHVHDHHDGQLGQRRRILLGRGLVGRRIRAGLLWSNG